MILELGTNGSYSVTQLDSLLNSLGPMKKIVLINTRVPRTWQTAGEHHHRHSGQQLPQRHPHELVRRQRRLPAYFYTDGVHLNPQGAQYYASLIVQALDAPLPATGHSPAGTTTTAR